MKPQTPILGHAASYPALRRFDFDRSLWESAQRIIAENKARKKRKSTAPKLDRRRLTPPAKALPHRAGKHN